MSRCRDCHERICVCGLCEYCEENEERVGQLEQEMDELKSAADKLAEALEFYASIDPDKPSAALAVDKFQMARDALKEYRGVIDSICDYNG